MSPVPSTSGLSQIATLYADWAKLYIAQSKMDDAESEPYQQPLCDLETAISALPITSMQDLYLRQMVETCFGNMCSNYLDGQQDAVYAMAKAEIVERESLLALIDLHRENYAAWDAVFNFADKNHPDYDPSRKAEVQAHNDRDAELMERIILHPANSMEVIVAKGQYLASHQKIGALCPYEAVAFVETFAADVEKGLHNVDTLQNDQWSIPAVSAAAENPAEKVSRIAFELSDALNGYADQHFHAVVYPSEKRGEFSVGFISTNACGGDIVLPIAVEKLNDRDRANYHLKQAAKAMKCVTGGYFWFALAEDFKSASIYEAENPFVKVGSGEAAATEVQP